MTTKRYRKLLRAEFTAAYLKHGHLDRKWMANAYRVVRRATAGNKAAAYESIKNALRS